MTYNDLGKAVKAKYPQYQGVDDATLGQKIAAKYPQYQAQIAATQPPATPSATPTQETPQRSFIGNLGSSVMGAASAITQPLRTVAEAGARTIQNPMAIIKGLTGQQLTPEEAQTITQQSQTSALPGGLGLSPEEQRQFTSEPAPLAATRLGAGLFSLFAPFAKGVGIAGAAGERLAPALGQFGKGTNLFSRATIPGTSLGAMSAFSRPGATTEDVVGGAALGGVTATAATAVLDRLIRPPKIDTSKLNTQQSEFLKQFGAPTAVTKKMNLLDTSRRMTGWGFGGTSQDELQNIAQQMTGDTGKITQMTRDSIANVGRIAIPDSYGAAADVFGGTVSRGGKIVGSPVLLSKTTRAGQALGAIRSAWGNMNSVDAEVAFDTARGWEKLAADYASSNNTEDKLIAKALRAAADEVTDKISKTAVDTGIIDALKTPENYQFFAQYSPKMAEDFMAARNLADIRSLAAPWVNTSRLINETTKTQATIMTSALNRAKESPWLSPQKIPALLLKAGANRIAFPAIRGGARAAVPVAKSGAAAIAGSPFLTNLLGQASVRVPQQALMGGATATAAPNAKATYYNASGNRVQSPITNSQIASGIPTEAQFQRAIVNDLKNNKGRNVSKLVAAHKAIYASQAAAQGDRSYSAAIGTLNQLQSDDFTIAGGAKASVVKQLMEGTIPFTNLKVPGKLYNDPESLALINLNDRFEKLRNTIVPYLEGRRGGTIYFTRANAYIPSITDSPEQITIKLNNLSVLMQAVQGLPALDTTVFDTTATAAPAQ